jgi:predicted secreted protein
MASTLLRFLVVALAFGLPFAVAGADEDKLNYNLVSLQAQSSKAVTNDLARASLAVEVQGKNPAQVADQINVTMDWALKRAKARSEVEIESGGYRTYPTYEKTILTGWRGIQELHLESSAVGALSMLIGELQAKLQVKSMGFAVSAQRRRDVENELIGTALEAFKERADLVRKGLGADDYRIVELSVGTSTPHPPPMFRAERMGVSAAVTPPAIEAGESDVTVTVSGTIQLQ